MAHHGTVLTAQYSMESDAPYAGSYFDDLLLHKDGVVEQTLLGCTNALDRQTATGPVDGHVPTMAHDFFIPAELSMAAHDDPAATVPTTAFQRRASLPTAHIPPTLPHTPAPFADPTAFHVPDVHGKTDTCVAVPNLSLASQSLPDSASTDKSHDPKSEHRRQRNRKAAQHSRERKKQFIRGLEQRNAELEGLVVSLKREVEALQRQNGVRDAFVRCTLPIGTCHTQLCAGVASDHHQLEIQPSNLLRAVTDHDITFYRLLPGGA